MDIKASEEAEMQLKASEPQKPSSSQKSFKRKYHKLRAKYKTARAESDRQLNRLHAANVYLSKLRKEITYVASQQNFHVFANTSRYGLDLLLQLNESTTDAHIPLPPPSERSPRPDDEDALGQSIFPDITDSVAEKDIDQAPAYAAAVRKSEPRLIAYSPPPSPPSRLGSRQIQAKQQTVDKNGSSTARKRKTSEMDDGLEASGSVGMMDMAGDDVKGQKKRKAR